MTGAVTADTEATFVPGDPPRTSWLALWGATSPIQGADAELELALPAGKSIRRRRLPVRRLDMDEALDFLIRLGRGHEVSRSTAAWASAARLALDLVARGRLTPARSPDGFGAWHLGPLDPADAANIQQLADALPAEAHASVLPGSGPVRLVTPGATVTSFGNAVADVMPRTAAAASASGAAAFSGPAPVRVDEAGPWLDAVATDEDEAAVTLRLEPPGEDGGLFRGRLLLTSRRDPSLTLEAAELWDAPDIVLARLGDAEQALLVGLRRGARAWAPLGRLLDEARPAEIVFSDAEAEELLGPAVDALGAAGISVLWPQELLAAVSVRPVVATPAPAAVTGSGLSLDSLVELRWEAAIDGEALTEVELAALVEAKRPLVQLRGRWVVADPDRMARLTTRHRLGAGEALAAALGGTLVVGDEVVEAEVEGPIAHLAARLKGFASERERPEPDGLEATLRPYQRRGLAWMAEMADLGLGGVLADDMGLGKTVQVLGLHLVVDGPMLVVCPASLLGNWEREAGRFSPSVPVRRFHGADRSVDDLAPDEVVLATYGVARRDVELLATVDWGLVVADEAQAIKNPLARTARAMRQLDGQARFALTGTPVENRLTELWAILDWTTPGLLGPLDAFRRRVAVPVERDRDPEATAAFAALVRPFVLRRRKSDPAIAPDLPPKTETDRLVPLSTEQATLYRAVVAEVMAEIEESDGMARRGLVLKLLTALKQVCNHPAQYLGQSGPLTGRSGKLEAATELIEVIAAEGDAVLVFTQYVAMGRLLQRHLEGAGLRVSFLHGSVPVGRRQEMVDRFQAGDFDVFVISLKAGGTGLNLTRATHVVHYDRWWNPAVEDQASDRAWRIGQDRAVQVHRMICEGTVEDRIAVILEQKRALADAVVSGGEAWVTELSNDELAELVSLTGTVT